MKISKLLLITLSGSLLLSACAPAGTQPPALRLMSSEAKPLSASDGGSVSAVSQRINDFSLDIASRLHGESFVFSPFSVYMALALLSQGAEGETRAQLMAALCPEGVAEEDFAESCGALLALLTDASGFYGENSLKLAIASLVCTDHRYSPSARVADAAASCFAGELAAADFSRREVYELVNSWAVEKTRGMIKELLSEPLSRDTMMLLANSVYFCGKWEKPFDPELTEDAVFHGLSGDAEAKLMSLSAPELSFAETETLQAVRLPYCGGACMTVYLPRDGADFSGALSAIREGGFNFSVRTGTVRLPRFTMDFRQELKDVLSSMGMEAMFSGGLAPMVEETDVDLCVSDAFQKARIAADEEGTEAAAVTVIMMARCCLPIPTEPFEMVCDRPFMYTITRAAGDVEQLLFIGSVGDL